MWGLVFSCFVMQSHLIEKYKGGLVFSCFVIQSHLIEKYNVGLGV